MNGKFIISLDFELHWGVFDSKPIENYQENLQNTPSAVAKILELSNQHNIRLTFSTVGFLFNKNIKNLKENIPTHLPTYTNEKLNPYAIIDNMDANSQELSPYYFAESIIKNIQESALHEIGTHTYSHYYCLAKGQNINQFESDLIMAIKASKNLGIEPKSIVFPRNQINHNYLNICKKHGISSYRGTERAWPFRKSKFSKLAPAFRLLDSYINVFGNHTYSIKQLSNKEYINLPSSRFLRPFNKKLQALEPLKLRRIKKSMTYAAMHNQLYHIWWHPHNFGKNLEKNLNMLTQIYNHYQELQKKYNFESETMTSLSSQLNK
jgi:peptidoglycan/xylan/chitin deacetylase (PgdA/CDA1 family)